MKNKIYWNEKNFHEISKTLQTHCSLSFLDNILTVYDSCDNVIKVFKEPSDISLDLV